jgi:hypothetical protein
MTSMVTPLRICLAGAMLAALIEGAAAEVFVVRVGNGAAPLTNASTPTFVDRFNDNGTPSASPTIALPTDASGANKPLTNSGTATSEGYLNLSTNGQYLTLAGYAVGPGTAGVAGTTSQTINRVVGRIEIATGGINTSTAFTDSSYSENNIRSAITTNGTDIWTSGAAQAAASGGVRFTTLGSNASTQISSTLTNTRVVDIFNNQLFVSAGAGAFRGVNKVGNPPPPKTVGQTITLLPGFNPSASSPENPYEFWFKDANTLYVADDRQAPNGGIQKWQLNSGTMTWSLAYTLTLGTGAGSGARGLAGTVDGANNAVLYATTTEESANRLISVTDTGAASAFSLLATAGTNRVFRGVEFVPGGGNPVIDADFDNRNGVDGNDFLIWQRGLGVGAANAQGDANGDAKVDATDLAAWKTAFSSTSTPIAAVPEPGCLALSLIAAIAAFGRGRGRSCT